jgi:hypothetical protein
LVGGPKGKRPLGIPRGRWEDDNHKHHHKHQGLEPLIRSVSKVTTALSNVSSVFQLFSFLVACSGMISRGSGFVETTTYAANYRLKSY